MPACSHEPTPHWRSAPSWVPATRTPAATASERTVAGLPGSAQSHANVSASHTRSVRSDEPETSLPSTIARQYTIPECPSIVAFGACGG